MPKPPLASARISAVSVAHVIIRACTACGAPRQLDTPCAGCGNTAPPVVHDLGVVAAHYRNPLRRAWWLLARQPLSRLRIRRANRHTREG
jgi:hypothetical protein